MDAAPKGFSAGNIFGGTKRGWVANEDTSPNSAHHNEASVDSLSLFGILGSLKPLAAFGPSLLSDWLGFYSVLYRCPPPGQFSIQSRCFHRFWRARPRPHRHSLLSPVRSAGSLRVNTEAACAFFLLGRVLALG